MDHFAGLDVSVKETSVCIVDDTGKIVREVKVESEPEALLAVLKNPAYHFKRSRKVKAAPKKKTVVKKSGNSFPPCLPWLWRKWQDRLLDWELRKGLAPDYRHIGVAHHVDHRDDADQYN